MVAVRLRFDLREVLVTCLNGALRPDWLLAMFMEVHPQSVLFCLHLRPLFLQLSTSRSFPVCFVIHFEIQRVLSPSPIKLFLHLFPPLHPDFLFIGPSCYFRHYVSIPFVIFAEKQRLPCLILSPLFLACLKKYVAFIISDEMVLCEFNQLRMNASACIGACEL